MKFVCQELCQSVNSKAHHRLKNFIKKLRCAEQFSETISGSNRATKGTQFRYAEQHPARKFTTEFDSVRRVAIPWRSGLQPALSALVHRLLQAV